MDMMNKYFEISVLLGYDMEGNKEKMQQMLVSIDAIQVDQ